MRYTHVGHRGEVGHVHAGRLYGHADYRGRSHALTGTANTYSGAPYVALCGRTVTAEHDGERFNVRPATGAAGEIGCRRCRHILEGKR